MTFEDIIKNDAEQLSKAMETDAAKFFTHEIKFYMKWYEKWHEIANRLKDRVL